VEIMQSGIAGSRVFKTFDTAGELRPTEVMERW
jgi:hypothetical protein